MPRPNRGIRFTAHQHNPQWIHGSIAHNGRVAGSESLVCHYRNQLSALIMRRYSQQEILTCLHLSHYCPSWSLQCSQSVSIACTLHRHNIMATNELTPAEIAKLDELWAYYNTPVTTKEGD